MLLLLATGAPRVLPLAVNLTSCICGAVAALLVSVDPSLAHGPALLIAVPLAAVAALTHKEATPALTAEQLHQEDLVHVVAAVVTVCR